MELKKWKLDKFFIELFNYCFPPDFRLRQGSKLNEFEQKHMRVNEYAAELLVMFRTIGSSTKRERVEKLWNGLRPELQQALWRENLEPQHSTWKQVLRVAERHEIADQIVSNDKRSIGNGTSGSKNQNNRQKLYYAGGNGNNSSSKPNEGKGSNWRSQNGESGSSKTSGSYEKPKINNSGDKPRYQASKPSELTEKQKADYMAEGRCFGHGGKDHISSRCPSCQSVKSASLSSKPPGVKSFSVKVAADREKTLRALSSTMEEPNTVSSAAIHFDEFARIEEINDKDYCMSVEMNYVGLEEVESLGEESGSDNSETLVPEPVSLQDFEDLALIGKIKSASGLGSMRLQMSAYVLWIVSLENKNLSQKA
jgi:hypothetical protein